MFSLNVVTPEKNLVSGREIEEVFVPGYRGELNILPGHAPLVTTLTTGILKYRLKGETQLRSVALSWGYCEVYPGGVAVLAETAETPEEIDVERVQRAVKVSEEKLKQIELEIDMMEKYQNKLARAIVRKEVAGLASGTKSNLDH